MAIKLGKFLSSGSGDIDLTIDPVAPGGVQVLELRINFASNATNDIAIVVKKGTDYSYAVTTLSGSGQTQVSWEPSSFYLYDDEQIDIDWTNPGVVDWDLRMMLRKE